MNDVERVSLSPGITEIWRYKRCRIGILHVTDCAWGLEKAIILSQFSRPWSIDLSNYNCCCSRTNKARAVLLEVISASMILVRKTLCLHVVLSNMEEISGIFSRIRNFISDRISAKSPSIGALHIQRSWCRLLQYCDTTKITMSRTNTALLRFNSIRRLYNMRIRVLATHSKPPTNCYLSYSNTDHWSSCLALRCEWHTYPISSSIVWQSFQLRRHCPRGGHQNVRRNEEVKLFRLKYER